MFRVRFGRPLSFAAVGAAAAFLTMTGCNSGDDLAGVENSKIVLAEATAKVNGDSIDGQTIRTGHNDGTVRFEAHLVDHRNNPAPAHKVRVEFDIPGMGMMHHTGMFMLHDDGTHGDLVPHDGVYCYEDVSSQYGCHGPSARPGDYHYEFCGIDHNGHESNRIMVNTVLAP
jgi:hypothetical protein